VTRAATPEETVEVHIMGAPVRVWVSSSERHQDLVREFTLLQFGHEGGQSVPSRLLDLSQQLTGKYSRLTETNKALRDEALAAGQDRINLTYEVPAEVREPCIRLLDLLEEADEYCRSDQLLTLATPLTQVAFRRWYLGEFIAQIDGRPPQPWTGPLDSPDDESTQRV
jgi:hypothetical protein